MCTIISIYTPNATLGQQRLYNPIQSAIQTINQFYLNNSKPCLFGKTPISASYVPTNTFVGQQPTASVVWVYTQSLQCAHTISESRTTQLAWHHFFKQKHKNTTSMLWQEPGVCLVGGMCDDNGLEQNPTINLHISTYNTQDTTRSLWLVKQHAGPSWFA